MPTVSYVYVYVAFVSPVPSPGTFTLLIGPVTFQKYGSPDGLDVAVHVTVLFPEAVVTVVALAVRLQVVVVFVGGTGAGGGIGSGAGAGAGGEITVTVTERYSQEVPASSFINKAYL